MKNVNTIMLRLIMFQSFIIPERNLMLIINYNIRYSMQDISIYKALIKIRNNSLPFAMENEFASNDEEPLKVLFFPVSYGVCRTTVICQPPIFTLCFNLDFGLVYLVSASYLH